jgi:hypothetical protein
MTDLQLNFRLRLSSHTLARDRTLRDFGDF